MLAIIALSLLFGQTQVSAQGLLSGFGSGIRGQQSPIDQLPGFGACDRIASRGVANCMENFLPTNVLSGFTGGPRGGSGGNICCKYRACIAGLHDGLRIAMQRERCPKSYSTKIIKSLGDNSVGSPLRSQCADASTGKSQCPKTRPKKKKPTQKRRTQSRGEREELDPVGNAGGVLNQGLGGLAGLNPLNGGLNPLNGGSNPFGGLGGGLGGLGGLNPLGSSLNPVGSGFNPGGDLFGGSNRRTNTQQGSDFLGPVKDVVSRGAETFQQGMSGILNGAQSFIGGFGGVGRGIGGNTRGTTNDRFN